eukprot:COSAG06_NODE_829_length_12043_cov_8.656983_9_plen_133_part_00
MMYTTICHDRIGTNYKRQVKTGAVCAGPHADMGGIIGASAERNPDFFDDHHVHIAYCDGTSLSSGRSEPVAVPPNRYHNGSLYFRGRANIDAVIMEHGLASFSYDSLKRSFAKTGSGQTLHIMELTIRRFHR